MFSPFGRVHQAHQQVPGNLEGPEVREEEHLFIYLESNYEIKLRSPHMLHMRVMLNLIFYIR